MSSKTYTALKSEWPTEIGIVDQVEKTAKGPTLSTEGIGSPIDAPQMLLPGIYAIPPIGSKVQFMQTEEGPVAGMMVDWPEEQKELEKLALKSGWLPNYAPGDVLIFSSGAMITKGYVQYIHLKTDGSLSLMTVNLEEPDSTKQVITQLKSDKTGISIDTKSFSVLADTVSIRQRNE